MNSVRKGKCPTDVSPKETELKCGLKASRGKTGGLAVLVGLDGQGGKLAMTPIGT